ncbi:hypothetical protein CMV_021399 [Castanea mollissima]|uniref:Myb-like domain-containing protein n=1 Tax=Castanea mollissima TaxID=60419 RepID=A0A8J4QW89_9ROSI|nr:hypothetical protein CMV_021399 [Castanea mollissima]
MKPGVISCTFCFALNGFVYAHLEILILVFSVFHNAQYEVIVIVAVAVRTRTSETPRRRSAQLLQQGFWQQRVKSWRLIISYMGKKTLGKEGNKSKKDRGNEADISEVNGSENDVLMRVEEGIKMSSEDERRNEERKEKKKKHKKEKSKDGIETASYVNEILEGNTVDELVKGQDSFKKRDDDGKKDGKESNEKKEKKKKKHREEKNKDGIVTASYVNEILEDNKVDELVKGQDSFGKRDNDEMKYGKEAGEKEKKKKKHKEEKNKDGIETASYTNETLENNKVDELVKGQNSIGKRDDDETKDGKVVDKKGKKRKRDTEGGDVTVKNNMGKEREVSDRKNTEKVEPTKKKGRKDIETSDHNENSPLKRTPKRVSFSDNLVVFPSSDAPIEGNSDQDDSLVRGKRFSQEEDEMVKKAVFDYIEEHQLGDEGLNMVLHCKSHRKTKNCWKEIAAALPWRPTESVYYRAHILFERGENRKWTQEEYELIRSFHKKHGSEWKLMADALGKHRFHVKDTWRRIKLPNMKKGRWSQEEYQNLFDLVNLDLRMKASEEKKSKHGLWADADDYRLLDALYSLDACCIEDVDWDDLLEHRSGEVCQKRWDQMVKHLGEHSNKSFAEQVEVLSKRYRPDVLEAREAYDSKPAVS